jgi:hypothetical protein
LNQTHVLALIHVAAAQGLIGYARDGERPIRQGRISHGVELDTQTGCSVDLDRSDRDGVVLAL